MFFCDFFIFKLQFLFLTVPILFIIVLITNKLTKYNLFYYIFFISFILTLFLVVQFLAKKFSTSIFLLILGIIFV